MSSKKNFIFSGFFLVVLAGGYLIFRSLGVNVGATESPIQTAEQRTTSRSIFGFRAHTTNSALAPKVIEAIRAVLQPL